MFTSRVLLLPFGNDASFIGDYASLNGMRPLEYAPPGNHAFDMLDQHGQANAHERDDGDRHEQLVGCENVCVANDHAAQSGNDRKELGYDQSDERVADSNADA